MDTIDCNPRRRLGARLRAAGFAALLLGPAAAGHPLASRSLDVDGTPGNSQPEASSSLLWLDPVQVGRVLAILSPDPDGPGAKDASMPARLGALGTPAIPAMLALLAGEVEDIGIAAVDGDVGHHVDPEAVMSRLPILRAGLYELPASALVSELVKRAQEAEDVHGKLFVVDLLGDVDDRAALQALLDIVSGIEPIHHSRPYVIDRLQDSIGRQLAHSSVNVKHVESFARRCDPAVMPALVRAVGSTGSSKSLSMLARWVDLDPSLKPIVVSEIAACAKDLRGSLPETTVAKMRGLLLIGDDATSVAAVRVLGEVRDSKSTKDLVTLLEARPGAVAETSRWALERITGKRLGKQGGAWRAHLAAEERWWRQEAPELLHGLDQDDPGDVLKALLPLLSHPLHRHELSDRIAALLRRREPELVQAACSALVQLDSPHALQPLVDGLGGSSKRVQELCGEALCSLTGLELPAESKAWQVVVAD